MTTLPQPSDRQKQRICAAISQLADTQLPDRYALIHAEMLNEAERWIIRLDVEGRGFRISLDECADVSRLLGDAIDTLPELAGYTYTLEVGSPGLFRTLNTPREWAFYTGWLIKVEKHLADNSLELLYEGTLTQADTEAGTFIIEVDGNPITVDMSDVQVSLNPPVQWPEDEGDEVDTSDTISLAEEH